MNNTSNKFLTIISITKLYKPKHKNKKNKKNKTITNYTVTVDVSQFKI